MTLDEVKRQNTGELWPPIHEVVFDVPVSVGVQAVMLMPLGT